MQIVIDIDEDAYQLMKDGHISFSVLDAIMNGTPLPKGHGKIIDESAITEVYTDETEPVKINGVMVIPPRIVITSTNAPTIIEADRSDEE